MKKVYIVTHGEVENKPDPSLAAKGKRQMKKVKNFLKGKKFDLTISGIGKRHKESFKIIVGLKRKPDIECEAVGVRERVSVDKKELVFPDGKRVPVEEYAKTRYKELLKRLTPLLNKVFEKEGSSALIVGGRIVVIPLGVKDPISGVIYIFDRKRKLVSVVS
jgi:broad specificity phosphatase PhoE